MASLDTDAARGNMLINQIRAWDVLDPDTLEILRTVPRERFVAESMRHLAFADEMIPIGHGQVMFSPKYEGRFLQALRLTADDQVLEVGTGSGYMAALLATRARAVVTVDIYDEFCDAAARRLQAQNFRNVRVEQADGSLGYPAAGPYDVILVTGSMPVLAQEFLSQLRPGGRLGVILGESPVMVAQVITITSAGEQRVELLFDTDLPPLINARGGKWFQV